MPERVQVSSDAAVDATAGRSRDRLAAARPESATDLADLRWVVGVWVLVAVFAAVTAVWSQHVGIPLRDPRGQMFRSRLTSALILFGLLAVGDAALRARGGSLTPRGLLEVLRARWPWRRLALALSGLLAYHLVYICYRNLKSWDVFNTPRDQDLLAVDKWLFLGHSPAVLLHDLLGQHTSAYVLMVIYKAFTYMVPLAVVGSLVFVDRIRDGYVFLTAALWVWILGVGSYYLIPSLGPFASAPAEFAGLPHSSITATQAEYLSQRAYLLQHPGSGHAFASISAFASLHVAFTTLVVLMLAYYRRTRAAAVMGVYLAGVMVATVYLGWHFVVDDIAGLALAGVSVLLGHLMIHPRGRP